MPGSQGVRGSNPLSSTGSARRVRGVRSPSSAVARQRPAGAHATPGLTVRTNRYSVPVRLIGRRCRDCVRCRAPRRRGVRSPAGPHRRASGRWADPAAVPRRSARRSREREQQHALAGPADSYPAPMISRATSMRLAMCAMGTSPNFGSILSRADVTGTVAGAFQMEQHREPSGGRCDHLNDDRTDLRSLPSRGAREGWDGIRVPATGMPGPACPISA
jgi:hypothetical protein